MHISVKNSFPGASPTIVTLVQEVSDLVPNEGPLFRVLGITAEVFAIIAQIKSNKNSCEFLVERILRFLKDIAAASKRLDSPIRAGTPKAASLKDLLS